MSKPKVVVVGAGAIGLFCALRLAERGADVTVLESEANLQDGAAASLIAAGMLAPLSEAHLEPKRHARAAELGLASFDLWRAAAASLRAHARFEGGLLLGEEEVDSHGRALEPLSARAIAQRFALKPTMDGVFVADEGVVDSGPMLRALADALAAAGGKLILGVDAETIAFNPRRVRTLDGEDFAADHVMLAPGAWAREPLQEIAPALKHVRPAHGALAPVMLDAPLGPNVRGPGFYLAPRSDGAALLGATMRFESYERRADPGEVDALFAAAERALPGQVRHVDAPARAGVRPMSPDWAPMIGPSGPDGVLIACGHSRNGWLLAPITAEIVCAYVFGETISPLWAAFAPDRFG